MPYLISPKNNPNDQSLVDDADLAYAQQSGYDIVRYVPDAEADTLAVPSTVGPTSFQPVGYDPTAPQTRSAAEAAVNFANAVTNQTQAETAYIGTLGEQWLAARGPKNAFQYANASIGQPKSTIPAWATALKGVGELVYSPIADMDRQPLAFGDFMRSGKTATSVGSGGGDAQGSRASTPTPPSRMGGSTPAPFAIPVRGGQTGPIWSPEMGRYVFARGPESAAVSPVSVAHGAGRTPGPIGAAYGYAGIPVPPESAAVSQVQAVSPVPYLPATRIDRFGAPLIDTAQYAPASGLSGRGDSKIAWKNKLSQLVGKGSAARSAAYAKAGMSGADFNRLVKHGKDPFARAPIAAAAGYSGALRSDATSPTAPPWPLPGWSPENASGGTSAAPPTAFPEVGWPPPATAAPPATVGGNPAPYPPATPGVGTAPAPWVPPANASIPSPPREATRPPANASIPSTPPATAPAAAPAPVARPATAAAAAAQGQRTQGRAQSIAAQSAEYARLMHLAARWYAAQFGMPLEQAQAELGSTDPDTAAYLRAALGMARSGEIDRLLGPEQPAAAAAPPAPAAAPALSSPADRTTWAPGITDTPWARQQLGGGDYAGAAMGGVGGGLALGPAITPAATGFEGMLPPPDMGQGAAGAGALLGGGAPPMGMPSNMPTNMPPDMGMAPPSLDPTNPQQPPEALQQIAAILQAPPSPGEGPLEQAVRANWMLGPDGQPVYTGTAPAQAGGSEFVVTDPTGLNVNGQPFITGEGSADELVQATPLAGGTMGLRVVPLQRPGMAVPAWAAQRANALVPGDPYAATPAWAGAPIAMATGGTAVIGAGSPAVLYPGSTVGQAARPVGSNRGISETGQVSVAGRSGGYQNRPVKFIYQDPATWNPVVAAQIQANPTLLAMQNSGMESIGLDAPSSWAAFYSSLPRQNPGTAVRRGAY